MAALFLAVWLQPEWFGWEAMNGLKAAVFVEVLAVFGFLLMLTGLEDPDDWVGIVYLAAFLFIVLGSAVNLLVGVFLPLHLVARVAKLRSGLSSVGAVARGVLWTAFLIGGCWVAVGVLPLPALGWTDSVTPLRLWFEVPRFGRMERVSFGLPAWGFLYFFSVTLISMWGLFRRFVERTAHKSTLGAT